MKNFNKFFLLLSLSFAATGYPEVKKMTSMQEICDYIINDNSCLPSEKLVLFDIDYTLGCCSLEFSSLPFNIPFKVLFPSGEARKLPLNERVHYIFKLNPMESSTLHNVQSLKNSGIPVLALTARPVDGAQRVYQQLADMGINFSVPANVSINKTVVTTENADVLIPYGEKNKSEKQSATFARFFKGVICCDNKDKGIVLQNFLKQFNVAPKKVYFIDDRNYNVTDVNTAMQNAKIACSSIEYIPKKKSSSWCITRDTLTSIAIVTAAYALYYRLTH